MFEHWKTVMGHQRSTFDKKRRAAVEARLRDGYTPADLMAAVDGCALTPHNMGKNDRGERYDDLELICRDAAHVDRFKRNAMTPPSISAQRPRDPRFGMARAEDQHHPDLGPNGEARPLWFPGDDPALDPSRIP